MNFDVMTLVALFGGVLVYLVPSVMALGRPGHPRVMIVNLLLGWTVVGWVVALVWAMRLPPANASSQ